MSSLLPDCASPSDSRAAAPPAPILVLLPTSPAPGVTATQRGDLNVLGVTLAQRMVLAAGRAGYDHIVMLAADHTALPGITTIAAWRHLDAAIAQRGAAPLLIVPETILAEPDWLEALAGLRTEPIAWAASDTVISVGAPAVPEALVVLAADGGARDLTAVRDRLTRHFGPPARLPDGLDPVVVAAPADIGVAERRLLRALVKDTDGFMARHVERPISLAISRQLAATSITPNQMTLISMAAGLAGAPCFLSAQIPWQTMGALLFLAHSILDGCDGELARLKFHESRLGGVLDFWSDNVVHVTTFACMAAGWSAAVGQAWPLWPGAAAVLGTLGSAGLVYWRTMRTKRGAGPLYTSVSTVPSGRLGRLLDALSRRDFIYLVVALALIGKASWFLLLASLGAPTYFFLLVFLALRDGAAKTPMRSGR